MADIYVNRRTGDDRNPGTPASPVKTILRATELAAEVPGSAGTIFVAPGVYNLDNGENFPLLVPPLYALEGESPSDPAHHPLRWSRLRPGGRPQGLLERRRPGCGRGGKARGDRVGSLC
jgi:hypothetical protein